jgi:hypothetical protein
MLENHDRTHCDGCLPSRKEEAWGVASTEAAAKLSALRAAGKDPAHGGEARQKRAETQRARIREIQLWTGPSPAPGAFVKEILPGLQRVPVRRMAEETGLSTGACSMIRRGIYVPHPRWWKALRLLASTSQLESSPDRSRS